jgi:hypothetical protein
MYIVGGAHQNKNRAREVLTRLVESEQHLATDAEVLQEILHRYHAINRYDAIAPALSVLRTTVDTVFPITAEDVEEAHRVLAAQRGLSARDAIHVAIMNRYEITEVLSFDAGFDLLPDIRRLA